MPRVSIGLPVYNECLYIREAIDSIKSQSYRDVHVFVSDNCSTDNTVSIIKKLINGDTRFSFVRHPRNLGSAFNFDYVRKLSTSDYFMWMGGHDVLSHNALECLVGVLDERPEASMAMAYPHCIDSTGRDLGINSGAIYVFDGEPIDRFKKSVEMLYDCSIIHSLFRRNLLEDSAIEAIISIDHILISKLLWKGELLYDDRCNYFRRVFDEDPIDPTMQKITGNPNITADRFPFAQMYLKTFADLYGTDRNSLDIHQMEILRCLVNRFGETCLPDNERSWNRLC